MKRGVARTPWSRTLADKSFAITLLRWVGWLLPGDWLKTTFYLRCVARPRRALRLALHGFYRMEHVYDVLDEVKATYAGRFSILEFGTNQGYAFRKLLYATRYLGLDDRVTVHAFDTFEGMPPPAGRSDLNLVTNRADWVEGQFGGGEAGGGNVEALEAYCRRHHPNHRIHKGRFAETLTDELLAALREAPPILVWIDCDFYSSAREVFDRLLPVLPSGCVVYFDEYEFNYGSRFSGEARIVDELNRGEFGKGMELVLDRQLSLDSQRVFRFLRFEGGPHLRRITPLAPDPGRSPTNDSALP